MERATDSVDTGTPGTQGSIADDLAISNGRVRCPVCEKEIKVGMGGLPNLWKQHNPGESKACKLALEKKNKLEAAQRSQPRLQSFFTKRPKDLVPPTVPIPRRVIAHVIEPTSSANVSIPSPIPNTLVNNLLADLETAISNLPSTHLDTTSATEDSAFFPHIFPTNMDRDDLWAVIFDPALNRFLGFGKSVESIAESLKGKKKALVSMVEFLQECTRRFKIDGALIEGKVRRLIRAIEVLQSQSLAPQPSDITIISDDEDIPTMPHNKSTSVVHQSQAPLKPCPGYLLTFPVGQWADTSYPFSLHTLLSLPWYYSARKEGFYLVSHSCLGLAVAGQRCRPCDDLGNNDHLKKIIARYTDGIHDNSPLVYHGIGGLVELVRRKTRTIDVLRLRHLNEAKKLIVQEGTIDVHKQMLLALSTQRIPRIDHILRIGFKHGAGIHSMLETIKKAAAGTYHPKGYDEEDDLQALLFLRLGGARVADIAHHIFGTPSARTIRTRTIVPYIVPSPSFPTCDEIQRNIVASFERLMDGLGVSGQRMLHAVAMFDELAIEKRPRWDDKSNKVLGICREHGSETSIEFTTEDDLETLWAELGCGKIHLAHEATVGAIAILSSSSRLYSARPILISGSCKKEAASEHAVLLQTVVDAANAKRDTTQVRLVSLASDGESRRGKALAKLTYIAPLAPTSPIHAHLVHLDLLDLFVGADDITADKDYKHVFKRLRNTLLREKGSVVRGVRLTCGLIRRHLRDAGHSTAHIEHVLNPTDKQDVVLAYTLLKDLWSLPPADSDSANQLYAEVRDALRLYGQFSYHLVFPYICTELSLSEQLEHLSTAIHLVLALYVYDDAKSLFIPNALFVDIGIMVKNVFFCVAKAKTDHPMEPFFIILLGTDRLETLFGILRTMVGNDANLDMLQLALRVTATTEVSNILARHPEWDRRPRRLQLPNVSKDMGGIPRTADHIGPGAYRCLENLCPSMVTLATPWKRGRLLAEDTFPWIKPILTHISATKNASILAPYGTSLVTAPLSYDDDFVNGSPETSPIDEPVSNDVTVGIRQLEDAAADINWRYNQTGNSAFSNTVQIGGITMNKSRAIAQQFRYVTSASSTDRLRRVAQESRFKNPNQRYPSVSDDTHVEGPTVSVLQPIATLVFCEQKLFLCIAEINGLFHDALPVDDVPVALLSEAIIQVSYQALRLIPASTTDDSNGVNDWRSSGLFLLSAKVPGALVQPINPTVASHIPCNSFFLFETSSLMAIASNLRNRVIRGHRKAIPHVKASEVFPYQEQHGRACFIVEELDANMHDMEHVGLACPKCQPIINFNPSLRQRVLEHIGAHILYDDSVDRSSEPCGLCLRPTPLCKIVLKTAKGRMGNLAIDMKSSSCPNLVKISIANAATCSETSPCTNHPMKCPYCPKLNPAVWTYNFRHHLLRVHPSVRLNDHKSLWTPSKLEKDGMKRVWQHRHKQPKSRLRAQRPSLVISETHRTHRILGETEPASEASDEGSQSDLDDEESVTDEGLGLASEPEVVLEDTDDREHASGKVEQIEEHVIEGLGTEPFSFEMPTFAVEGLDTGPEVSTYDIEALMEAELANEPLFLDSEPTRVGRKRKAKDMSGLSVCFCGERAEPDGMGSIRCRKAGCSTVWYHLQCAGYQDIRPRSWTCDPCLSEPSTSSASKKARRR